MCTCWICIQDWEICMSIFEGQFIGRNVYIILPLILGDNLLNRTEGSILLPSYISFETPPVLRTRKIMDRNNP